MGNRTKRILIVDDSETFLMYTTVLLHRMGFDKITSAKNGVEALKLLRILMPDVILLDIKMPQMDGITVLRHIKDDENTSNIPVIMVTIVSDGNSIEDCKRLGCSGYLTKPVKVTELNDTLNKCISYEGGKRRKFLRTSFEKNVSVTHNGITEEHPAICLSEGGIYVRKRNPFNIGTEVEISLSLKDDKILNLKGTVIYIRGLSGDVVRDQPGMAIEFKNVNEDASVMLRTYITELLTEDIIEGKDEPIITK
jgi:CheY-like chemotaxis protein